MAGERSALPTSVLATITVNGLFSPAARLGGGSLGAIDTSEEAVVATATSSGSSRMTMPSDTLPTTVPSPRKGNRFARALRSRKRPFADDC